MGRYSWVVLLATIVTLGLLEEGQSSSISKGICQWIKCEQYLDGESCAAFYVWADNKAIVGHKTCRHGLLYNRKTKNCDLPEKVDCGGIPIIAEFRKRVDDEESGFFPHPDDCSRYIIHNGDGSTALHTCPSDLLFDKETKLCDRAVYVSC